MTIKVRFEKGPVPNNEYANWNDCFVCGRSGTEIQLYLIRSALYIPASSIPGASGMPDAQKRGIPLALHICLECAEAFPAGIRRADKVATILGENRQRGMREQECEKCNLEHPYILDDGSVFCPVCDVEDE